MDNALFGVGEFPAFGTDRKTAVTAEQVIDSDIDQCRFKGEQCGSAQRRHMHKVQVGRHRQVTGKFMIRFNFNTTDSDIRTAAQHVEQSHPELTGKTLVNNFQGLHTLADNAALGIRVIRTDFVLTFIECCVGRLRL